MRVTNLGPGSALNVRVLDASIDEWPIGENESLPLTLRFPDRVAVLPAGQSASVSIVSYLGDAEADDLFTAHIDPDCATEETLVSVEYHSIDLHRYTTQQLIAPKALSIHDYSGRSEG